MMYKPSKPALGCSSWKNVESKMRKHHCSTKVISLSKKKRKEKKRKKKERKKAHIALDTRNLLPIES